MDFYTSYTASEWKAGAMYLQVMDDPKEIEKKYGDVRIPSFQMPDADGQVDLSDSHVPKEVWHITIYGEGKGSILYKGGMMY